MRFESASRRSSTAKDGEGVRTLRYDAMSATVVTFVLAAFFEIAGCFAFWAWLRRGAPAAIVIVGVLSLIAFALALTRVDSAFAGRAYAAYGGIYIAASLV